MKRFLVLIALMALLFLTANAQAISSTNSRSPDWFVPLTGGGGGPAASATYAVNFTVGQTVVGSMASANYSLELGFWADNGPSPIYMPLILRNLNIRVEKS